MKTLHRSLLTGIALTLLVGQWAAAQVLDQLPQASLVVVKINHLGATSGKISAFTQQVGLQGMMPPEMADPLGALQKKAGIEKGLDPAGDAAFAWIDPKVSGERNDQSMLILVPVTNYNDFVSNFKDAKMEGGVGSAVSPQGDTFFFAEFGKFAGLSPSKAIVSMKPAGLKLPGASAKEMTSKDVIVFANFPAFREQLQAELVKGRQKMLDGVERDMTRGGKPDAAKGVPVAKAVVNQFMNAVDAFVRDTEVASFGISISPGGINSTMMAEFKMGSYLGDLMTRAPNSAGPLVTGLPDQKYLIWGGLTVDAAVMGQMMDDLIGPIMNEVAKLDEQKVIGDAVEGYRALIKATSGGSFGLVAPTGALGQSSLVQGLTVARGDAAAIRASQKKIYESQQAVLNLLGLKGTIESKYTANAKTIDGIAFDEISSKLGEPKTPQEMQMTQAMTFIYGPNGPSGLIGTVDNKTVLIAMGVDDAVISSAIAAAKANNDPFSKRENVKAVASELPKQRIGEMYIAVDTIATTALNYAAMMGMPFQVKLPADIPPVGITLATEGAAVRYDSHVSSALIKALVDAGMQAMMQMQGGGGPGGPGAPRPGGPDGL